MQTHAIGPTGLARGAAGAFFVAALLVTALALYAWFVGGNAAGLWFGLVFAGVLALSGFYALRAAKTERILETARRGELSTDEIDAALGLEPPQSDEDRPHY